MLETFPIWNVTMVRLKFTTELTTRHRAFAICKIIKPELHDATKVTVAKIKSWVQFKPPYISVCRRSSRTTLCDQNDHHPSIDILCAFHVHSSSRVACGQPQLTIPPHSSKWLVLHPVRGISNPLSVFALCKQPLHAAMSLSSIEFVSIQVRSRPSSRL